MSQKPNKPVEIRVGLQFTSRHFSNEAKIIAIRVAQDQVDLEYTMSNGDKWIQKGASLAHIKDAFAKGVYEEKQPDNFNLGVY